MRDGDLSIFRLDNNWDHLWCLHAWMGGQTDGPTGGYTFEDDDRDSRLIAEVRMTAVDINEKCIVFCGERLRNILRAIIEVLSIAKIASSWPDIDDIT